MMTELLRSRPAAGAAAPSQLYVARRSGAEIFLPSTGAPITVTSLGGGPGWGFGPWTLIATPVNDFYLSHAHICYIETAAFLRDILLELSRTGAHTPVDASRYVIGIADPTGDSVAYFPLDFTARPQGIPAGQAIYARAATVDCVARNFYVFLVGWDAGMPAWVVLPSNLVTGAGRYYPTNTNGWFIVPTPINWVYGASVTVVNPAPNDMLVVDVIFLYTGWGIALGAGAVQVGYGPVGGETWCATVPLGNLTSPWYIHPPVLIHAGERLALRGAAAAAGNIFCLVKVYDI